MRPSLKAWFARPAQPLSGDVWRTTHPDRQPSRYKDIRGFTIIELLITILILGLLIAIVTRKLSAINESAVLSTLQSNLKNLVFVQEIHLAETGGFIGASGEISLSDRPESQATKRKLGINSNRSVRLKIRAGQTGWTARAEHKKKDKLRCAIFVGDVQPYSPATEEGVVACDPRGKNQKKAKN